MDFSWCSLSVAGYKEKCLYQRTSGNQLIFRSPYVIHTRKEKYIYIGDVNAKLSKAQLTELMHCHHDIVVDFKLYTAFLLCIPRRAQLYKYNVKNIYNISHSWKSKDLDSVACLSRLLYNRSFSETKDLIDTDKTTRECTGPAFWLNF